MQRSDKAALPVVQAPSLVVHREDDLLAERLGRLLASQLRHDDCVNMSEGLSLIGANVGSSVPTSAGP